MADAITLNNERGMAARTGLDPANSGTQAATALARFYVQGPPTNGAGGDVGIWTLSLCGTQTNSNSMTAATYNFHANRAAGGAAPTTFTYVATGA
jgi:hypothetical protein